ncbi:MAG: glycosyltransferase family 39 protein [Anaerolineae bacterium]|nr:glycosyltransferase family 39 protein [Anaerolineae bacterium]
MLKTGDTWALTDHRHPPLLNMLAAAPLLFQNEEPNPRDLRAWGDDFILFVRALWPLLGPVERMAYVTRLPIILLSMMLIALSSRWSRELGGPTAALITPILLILDPTFFAHSQLNTTDIGFTFFAFLTIYITTHQPVNSSKFRSFFAGITLGCAILSKATGIILVPIVLILVYIQSKPCNIDERWLTKFLKQAMMIGGAVLLCFLVVYGIAGISSKNDQILKALTAHIDLLKDTLGERARSAFLAGDIRQGGWWWYFPYAFIIKTPIPSLILITTALTFLLSQPVKLFRQVKLWIFPALYLTTALTSRLNIGLRHLLPVYPFLYLFVSLSNIKIFHYCKAVLGRRGYETGFKRPFICQLVVLMLVTWQIIAFFTVYPFSLAYFNGFVGGSTNGYRYLIDSNVDWGQSFLALKQYMDRENIPWTWLSYYTWIDPQSYDITYQPLPPSSPTNNLLHPFNPSPGVYTLSATTLQGVMVPDPDLFSYFRYLEPVAQPGYGLLVYRIPEKLLTPSWAAQCTQPTVPLTPEAIADGFGNSDFRILNFDCTSGWVFPMGGKSSGWFIIHQQALSQDGVFMTHMQSSSRLSYQQKKPAAFPAFSIYEYEQNSLPGVVPLEGVFDNNVLTLTGFTLLTDNLGQAEVFEMLTQWRIHSTPDRPLSIMLHLVHAASGKVYTGDGLSFPVTEWRPADVLYQRHTIMLPDDLADGAYELLVGVYWLDTLERWPVSSQQQADQNTISIAKLMK